MDVALVLSLVSVLLFEITGLPSPEDLVLPFASSLWFNKTGFFSLVTACGEICSKLFEDVIKDTKALLLASEELRGGGTGVDDLECGADREDFKELR